MAAGNGERAQGLEGALGSGEWMEHGGLGVGTAWKWGVSTGEWEGALWEMWKRTSIRKYDEALESRREHTGTLGSGA